MKQRKTHTPEDEAFLASYDPARFERLSVAVDVALLTASAGRLHALLVQRTVAPQRGSWSLPGGFVAPDESLDAAAARVLAAKAGLEDIFLEQLYTFGAVDRDPRTRVVSVSYYALVANERLSADLHEGQRLVPLQVPWSGERGGPVEALDADGQSLVLAFDHAAILGLTVQRLRGKLDYAPIGFELLPPLFTLRALQDIHETIRGETLNKDSFRRRVLASGLLEPTGRRQESVLHRPAELYRFSKSEIQRG
jgi:8-oxo-dGTP diphosphatase